MQETPDNEQPQDESETMRDPPTLLAVDLGLRTGLALYTYPGHLTWYRSHHIKKRGDLKRAIWGILKEIDRLDGLFLEGDRKMAAWWQKAASKQFEMLAQVEVCGAERWRGEVLLPRQQQSGKQAKLVAQEMALEITRESPMCKAAHGALRHDTAESILIGAWGVSQMQWPMVLF